LPTSDLNGDLEPDENQEEPSLASNILDKDSDNDGLSDGDELDYWNDRYETEGIESLKPDGDFDNDGIPNILDYDSDNDGVSDGDELNYNDPPTDPADPDTDGDGINDGKDPDPAGPQNPSDLSYGGSNLDQTTGTSRNGFHSDPTCIAVFDPYLMHRKRLEIYDRIDSNYNAEVYDNSLEKIYLSDNKLQNEFTGIINLELSYQYIRIPSVAPNARIHSFTIYPNTELNFLKDGADNYYVKSSKTYGEAILTFTTSADSSYYTYEIPNTLTLDDVEEELITPPSSVISKANIVIEKLGLTGERNIKKIVDKLHNYFSGFTPGDIPSADVEPDDYLAMALYEHGCCYVRSFACFVTANSIGIPTRLVKNECHAFVEMYIPTQGWMELQLGGCGGYTSNPNDYDPFDKKPEPDDTDDDDDTTPNDDADDEIIWPWADGGSFETCPPSLINTTIEITNVNSNAEKLGFFNTEGYVKDTSDNGIENIDVLIFVTNDKKIPGFFSGIGKTDINGNFVIQCYIPEEATIGENHVIGRALGNDVYCGSWTDPIINITSNTTLELDIASSIGLGDSFEIKGKLVDNANQPLVNKPIVLKRNEIIIKTIYTKNNGEFFSTYSDTYSDFNITASFSGDKYLGPSEDSQNVEVKDTRTNLQMDELPSSPFKRGQSVNIKGSLTQGSDNPFAGAEIKIFFGWVEISSTITSPSGDFAKTINIPQNSNLGNITIKSQYPGSISFAEAQDSDKIFVQSETNIIIDSSFKSNVEQNETINITGSFYDDNNQALSNIKLNMDWELTNTNIITNENGIFMFNYKIPINATLGQTTLTISYNGNNLYRPSETSRTINIVEMGYVEETETKDESQNIYWLILIAIGIIVTMVGIIMILKKHKIQQNQTIQDIATHTITDLKSDGNYRKSVLKCYKEMCSWLSRQGVQKGSFQTPREFAMATKNFLRISPEGLYTLTQIFEKARYSKHEIDINDRDKAIKCLNEIVANPINIPVMPQNPQNNQNINNNQNEMNTNSF